MSANDLTSLGLILDMVGVAILFVFGFPQPDLEDHVIIVSGEKDPDAAKKRKKYIVRSLLGLTCLLVGFGLQLWAVWIP